MKVKCKSIQAYPTAGWQTQSVVSYAVYYESDDDDEMIRAFPHIESYIIS
jgi:hypothetical protein